MEKNCRCNDNCSCGERWKQEYQEYLEEEKCREEEREREEMSKPDNTYGLNPWVFNHTSLSVYLNYTGKDRIKWKWMPDKQS